MRGISDAIGRVLREDDELRTSVDERIYSTEPRHHELETKKTGIPVCKFCCKPMSQWRAGDECSGRKS